MRLRTYRFFDMGRDHNYLDDARNRTAMQSIAAESYIPTNEMLLNLIRKYDGRLKVSFYISGLAIEQMRSFAPEALQGFRKLAATGCAEFVAGTYSHSFAALAGREALEKEVELHTAMMQAEFGVRPTAFFDTAMLYNDTIGGMIADMGFKTILVEGARHVLGWKSPNFVYANPQDQKVRLLLRNYRLSDDLAFRFSDSRWNEWPLTADKFAGWICESEGETFNIFTDYAAIGAWNKEQSGIFDFIKAFVDNVCRDDDMRFATVTESAAAHQPIGVLYVNHETTWADEERDTSSWLGNELQQEAFGKLYAQQENVRRLDDPDFNHVWQFLQNADNFYWMATKWFTDSNQQISGSPYNSSYEAFINYMNVLSDFINELARRAESSGIEFAPLDDKTTEKPTSIINP